MSAEAYSLANSALLILLGEEGNAMCDPRTSIAGTFLSWGTEYR